MKKVCVYIDGANFYGGLTSLNKNFSDLNFDFENYVRYLCKKNNLIRIYYYNAHVKKKINKKSYKVESTKILRSPSFRFFARFLLTFMSSWYIASALVSENPRPVITAM